MYPTNISLPPSLYYSDMLNSFGPSLASEPQARIHDRSEIELDEYVLQTTNDEDEDDLGPPRKY